MWHDLWRRTGTITAALAVGLALACGGGGGGEGGAPAGGEAGAENAGPVVSPDSAATIKGVVSFEGAAPAGTPIDMSEEPTCAEDYQSQPMKYPAIVNDGKLANVYVHVKSGLPQRTWPTPSKGVEIDQQGCRYHPHVLAIQVGQPLIIKNADGILHNINVQPKNQQGFNVSQPVKMETTKTFSAPEVMVPVKCDVHGWMEAYIGVQEHPYASVSDSSGSFTLADLPPGTYEIEAWHEKYGTQTQQVTVGPKETKEITFTFSPATANAVPLGEPIDLHSHDARLATRPVSAGD